MDIMGIISWVVSPEGATQVFGILFGIMAVAQIIVNFTDTPKDNEILGKLYKWVERAAGIWGVKAKQLPGETDAKKKPE